MTKVDAENKIFVVIPAFNEEKSLAAVISRVKKYVRRVVVVDDASHDATAQVAREAGADVLRHMINCGQGAALRTGIMYALQEGADMIVTFDADGQHDAAQITVLIEPIKLGEVDVVLGSRFLEHKPQNMSFSRKLVLRMGILFTRIFSGIRITDTHNGFRALSRNAAQLIKIRQNRMAHASEILDEIVRHKLSFKEMPVTISYTEYSLKKGQRSLNSIKIALQFLEQKFFR